MPKQQTRRIIDTRRTTSNVAGAVSGGGSGGGSGAVVEANAGEGLYYSVGALHVGAGTGITVGADAVSLAATVAGDGLTHTAGVLAVGAGDGLTADIDSIAVGAGTLITVGANTVGITLGSAYQYIGTAAGTGAAWQNLSGLAGGGLSHTTGVLDVGAGAGLTVLTDSVALTTPGTLTVASANSSIGSHTHAITSSSAPGAAASLLATSASGGLQLDTDLLYVDAVNNRIGINKTPSGAALDISASATADHSQRIKQINSQTGRLWRIENTAGDELIVLDSAGNLQSGSPGFYSGLTGWQIQPNGNAEFNNVWVRGELHSSIFVMDEFHASGGTLMIATAASLENDATFDSTTSDPALTSIRTTSGDGSGTILDLRTTSGDGSGTQLTARSIENWIDITDPASGHAIVFSAGWVVRTKFFNGTDVYDLWLRINSSTDMTDFYRYHVEKMSGTDTTIPAGTAIISYGAEGDGRILLTSDLNYAPYMDIFTVGPDVWTGDAGAVVPHVRLGRLDGVGVPGLSGIEQYGIVAGTDLSDANDPYFYATNLGIKLYQVPLTLNDGSNDTVTLEAGGRVRFGTNVGTAAGTGFDFNPDAGTLTIGSASYPGTVTVTGKIIVKSGSSGIAEFSDAGGLATLDSVAWGSDLDDIPARFGDSPGAAGLYLTASYLGYYNGSAWKTFLASSGEFYFGGSTGAHLDWDGRYLRGVDSGSIVQWYADATTGKFYAGAGSIVLASNGITIKGDINTIVTGTPEPSTTPTLTPTATKYVAFPDPAASWYYDYLGADITKSYAGGDAARIYSYVEHIVPEQEEIGFWTHKSWLVLAAREPTLPASSGAWASEVYMDADIVNTRGNLTAANVMNIRSTA